MNKQHLLEDAWAALEYQIALNRKHERYIATLHESLAEARQRVIALEDKQFKSTMDEAGDQ